ncbi:MAG: permease-like cell division protein FtsX [Patescibacteria group bacterium]|nr:permease-like cell division protein FtsX [Patescibacteria group bacterium]
MKDIITSIRRTPYQSLTSFLILFFTLFLSLFFFNMTSFFNGILSYVETRPQVTVYFQDKVEESDIFKIRDQVSATGKTTSIKYVSKDEALQIYKDLNKNNPLLLEMVTAEILPASLEVYATKPEYLSQIAEFLKKQNGIDEVVFQKNIVDKLVGLTTVLRRISVFVLFFLLIISVIVLMTTTAFKIALKKDEIELMTLLGASKSYVRKPFILEGVFFGVASGTLAFLFFYLIFLYFNTFFKSYLAGIPTLPFYNLGGINIYVWPPSLNFVLLSYFAVILFGAGIGFVGNYISTTKYIK